MGLIEPISEWVLKQACTRAAQWPADLKIAVNLSPAQFRRPGLVETVVGALAASGLPADRLELEITESSLLQNSEVTLGMLYQLRELGVRIAMDDFGTGYSSLSYLQSFPFDKIKIDRSFVKDITDGVGSLNIVRAVTAMARGLGMTTTAEGVETPEQLEMVRAEGCTEMQGYPVQPAHSRPRGRRAPREAQAAQGRQRRGRLSTIAQSSPSGHRLWPLAQRRRRSGSDRIHHLHAARRHHARRSGEAHAEFVAPPRYHLAGRFEAVDLDDQIERVRRGHRAFDAQPGARRRRYRARRTAKLHGGR